MEEASYWLPLIWALILAVAVALYVMLDGFDLGLGILFTVNPDEHDRDMMMNTVAPFWDGNETWLVLGGAGLLVAFPLAYSIIMPALYLPVIIMLLALVFRGVAFEFRWVAKPSHLLWDRAFKWGSITAAFMQGVILGGLLQGIKVENKAFAGGTFDWLAPFPIFAGLGLIAAYALLGATWLVMKTEGRVAERAREHARLLLLAVVAAIVIVSIWTPLLIPHIWDRWFSWPNIVLLSPVPLLTAFAAWRCWWGLETRHDTVPFFSAIALFLLGFLGLAISDLPYLIPPTITIWEAAAHPSTQIFMLVGTLVLLPIILGYTVFVYYTFRGKLRPGEGYH